MFASVIWSLPGLSLTVAVLELSTKKNLVSGTSRFFGAIIVSMQIGFGINIGTRLGDWMLTTESNHLSVLLQTACSATTQIGTAFVPFLFVLTILCWNGAVESLQLLLVSVRVYFTRFAAPQSC